MRHRSHNEFEIAVICALPLKAYATEALSNEHYNKKGHMYGKQTRDANTYTIRRISGRHIVLAYMLEMGIQSSTNII